MLKGVDPLLGPELLYALARMGHGDELAVVDTNYPAYAAGAEVVRLDGVDSTEAIRAITSVMPLDQFLTSPLRYMIGTPGEDRRDVAQDAVETVAVAEGREVGAAPIHRLDFYEAARSVRLVVATGETRPYGCFLLTKGVWPDLHPGD
ncbi:fucose isomerase [Aeromicrobium sp. YIM 150415]|uniref:RbsD/FucU family protein n=1 Tax=Aeromicrobium sp. YIM 150415 TaxID=2803912 RepID=UPI00196331ED|nr:RbsD/FucU domain-containing protein [Aeromicrobium sp. YIM 150415]MBM9463953.1 fucose isomerase [Aeromicrobium sp. YIM 150415]